MNESYGLKVKYLKIEYQIGLSGTLKYIHTDRFFILKYIHTDRLNYNDVLTF